MNYFSNPITEHLTVNGANAAAQLNNGYASNSRSSEFAVSDKEYMIGVPASLSGVGGVNYGHVQIGNDLAMNVPSSFDYRELNQSSSRLNSNHMQLFGVTNPNHLQDKEYQSNKVTPTGGGRISSLRDEETLNVRWAELMK